MANDVERLGRYVADRRKDLGLSQIDVWHKGGPSNSTLTGIENGTAKSVSTSTLRKLDTALNWTPGSARSVLSGQEIIGEVTVPKQTDQSEATAAEPRDPGEWSMKVHPVPETEILNLIFASSRLAVVAGRAEQGSASADELVQAARVMGDAVQPVIESFFGGTEQMRQFAQMLMRFTGPEAEGPQSEPERTGDNDSAS